MQSDGSLSKSEYMTILVQFPLETFKCNNKLGNDFEHYYNMAEDGATHYTYEDDSFETISTRIAVVVMFICFWGFIFSVIGYIIFSNLKHYDFGPEGKKITKDFSQLNKYEVTEKGSKVAVIGLGTFYNMGCEVAKAVEEKTGTKATVINPYYITGIDEVLLEDLKKDHDVVITLEDGFLEGGFGEKIARFYGDSDVKVLNYGVKKELLDRYDVTELLEKNHLTVQQIVGDLKF